MDPLQHFVAPRRPSPRSKTREGVSRNVFTLPAIHQFEPVLASSSKSYMTTKPKDVTVDTDPVIPSQPQRPKSKEGVESPRIVRPQPPTGISSRTDVNIYRYSQGTEQRMAIRPLFEQRHSEEEKPLSTKKKVKKGVKKQAVSSGEEVADHYTSEKSEEDNKREVLEESGEIQVKNAECNQEEGRTSSPIPDDCFGTFVEDEGEVDRDIGDVDHFSEVTTENLGPSLLKTLSISSCYDPFLKTEGPKLTLLRDVVETSLSTSAATNSNAKSQSAVARAEKPDMLVYKTLGKDLRTLGDRSVLITVFLSSRGNAHVTCKVVGSSDESIVAISGSDLDQSKLLRRDLQVLTPKWADWIITRIRCDSRPSFYVDLTDASDTEKRICFSEIIHVNGQEITVEMAALMAVSSLLISLNGATFSVAGAEIILRSDDLRRLALSLGKLPDKGDVDHDVSTLFDDREFLSQLATRTNVVRLGMNCAGFVHEDDDSLLSSTCPTTSIDVTIDEPANVNAQISVELSDSPNYVQEAFRTNSLVGTIALLAQAYVENGMLSTLRYFQQQEAIQLNVAAFIQQAATIDSEREFNERVEKNLETARMSKLRDIAIASIVEDMIFDFIVYECRVEIQTAKYSGGYNDHYASKVQAAYRMSTQKRSYDHKRNVRIRAAQMLQALQRGITARRRYSEMKIEREKYLFYGFRSSLYHATANMKDPRLRARELSTEAEQRRHAFLMQVIQGYVAENFVDEEFRVSAQLVRDIYNEYGVVVGCSTSFGDVVISYLGKTPDQALYDQVGDPTHNFDSAPRLFSNSQVSVALLLGLRDQYDDTFGLSSSARRLDTGVMQRSIKRSLQADESAPPRWMLKTCKSFQQSNFDRLAGLRLTRKAAGRKSAHLIARDYRNVLASSFDSFDKCRATWEHDIRTRQEHQRSLDTFSIDELVQHCLDLLVSSVKDWGIDPDPLFEALNLCGCHCHGKAAIRIVEEKFNLYAAGMNEVHGKQSVLTLREEISQELEDFEKLLALRCLNLAVDDAVTVPTSELLHIMLKGNLDEEYIRHGLTTVLPIASIMEKHDLARKILHVFANPSYGDAFNVICWSCLDVAENVTVEAARFLDKITRPTTDNGNAKLSAPSQSTKKTNHRSSESLAARALYLLTGCQAVRFLQFLTKVAHFNKSIQKRVLSHLAPYADNYEMHRLASAVCSVEDFSVVSKVFDDCFTIDALQSCAPVWTRYKILFGEVKSRNAMNDMKVLSEPVERPNT